MASRMNGSVFSVAFLFLCAFIWGGQCSPTIDVSLRASFGAPPYLIELLETAAEENETSYFPLLDRIADGYFAGATTDEDVYNKFTKVLVEDGHLTSAEALSSFKFAVAIHSAAPRVEAHYQFYSTTVRPFVTESFECKIWAQVETVKYCTPYVDFRDSFIESSKPQERRQFDRILNAGSERDVVLYADIEHSSFPWFHKILAKSAAEGEIAYRVRYKPRVEAESAPLSISGYGVELALKRTDYIVIDDREEDQSTQDKKKAAKKVDSTTLQDDEISDITPLSSSELHELGLKSASFVLKSKDPFETLVQLTQNFPKHSSAVSSHSISEEFLEEFQSDRIAVLPPGYNIFWVNGVQLDSRQLDAFALLQHLRRERSLIRSLGAHGFTSPEALALLSHPSLNKGNSDEEPQRYDWRDAAEGGDIIIWLNNIEKDKRYASWSSSTAALLQRTYPGQLPTVRRDVFNLIIPMDLTNNQHVTLLVSQLQTFVQRGLALRFGIVPLYDSDASKDQAKLAYHLFQTYGLKAMLDYLESCLEDRSLQQPSLKTFSKSVENLKTRGQRVPLQFYDVLLSEPLADRVERAGAYAERLSLGGKISSYLINGNVLPFSDEWLAEMSSRLTMDLRTVQQSIFGNEIEEDEWIPNIFLKDAVTKRNPIVIPEDPSKIQYVNIGKVWEDHKDIIGALPAARARSTESGTGFIQLVVVTDLSTADGVRLVKDAMQARTDYEEVEVMIIPSNTGQPPLAPEPLAEVAAGKDQMASGILIAIIESIRTLQASSSWDSLPALLSSVGFGSEEQGLLVNGRRVGPLPPLHPLAHDDLEQVITFERSKRASLLQDSLSDLKLSDRISDALTFAKVSSFLSLSKSPETPEGIFEPLSSTRFSDHKDWKDTHSGFSVGDPKSSVINIVASIDPASELAQRFVPMLKVLSQLDGVHLKIFMNPRRGLEELPVKRFYQQVLEAEPLFDKAGSLRKPGARFTGIPKDSLLTAKLDVPPSWLVAPQDSVHDLDNIKLSSLKEDTDVEAIYELQHILIEGHSRDTVIGSPPRGVQLLLGTEEQPHVDDTIVMANLGYFQFKANPGFWKLGLKEGRSEEIYRIDSAGTKGYAPQSGDEIPDIELTSFQGRTLFPRLSRKSGKETEDVLEEPTSQILASAASNYLSKGLHFAQSVLGNAGLSSSANTTEPVPKTQHADINIFSVASGHLYERMLNIMMLSVMKHTDHTVKFWFIEQFLSPSFKSSLPYLAEEYGFSYEMVTYKWPHWLRAQKEKQREIWGYKILFLDVLFPLSLDKIIFVDADQIVRTDMYDLVTTDLNGEAYGFTPMCDSRESMEGFRFWKQGYWEKFLRGKPYHISALYVVDLRRFREIAAGDRLRGQYHTLSSDPASLSNLDQDLPNHMQHSLPIHSLDQSWLWCETWCSDETLNDAKTIDLCNNPLTKEPKLDRARRQVPEWTIYDEEARQAIAKGRDGIRDGEEREDETKSASDGGGIRDEL